jgi:hypothetical protein
MNNIDCLEMYHHLILGDSGSHQGKDPVEWIGNHLSSEPLSSTINNSLPLEELVGSDVFVTKFATFDPRKCQHMIKIAM